ncbi:uncharacterized protein P174DRAFT_199250 [Aspergillus novofumigatus IBT 16806]|uniref:Uncharacterized protein n=1 Tax=Aspergillus novofumigatus (strain IBT 16806) TaxID=1392255 RepID=A0A2I1C472_ASPN1|nr:uncharacterized protein P174DRAFT_199250 [Aspergillus novofumigatus IBT 16806]PKX92429.1 hypothetical protein P174DRAFT_199250 [Aspergillus novofumigatus IBT 16806]
MEVFTKQPIRRTPQPTLSTSPYGLLLLYYPLVIICFLLVFMLLQRSRMASTPLTVGKSSRHYDFEGTYSPSAPP